MPLVSCWKLSIKSSRSNTPALNVASSFAEQRLLPKATTAKSEDMRTADTMFGSGGSNKGSAEELSAADAVFGAVPDLLAPLPESSPPFNSSPTTTRSELQLKVSVLLQSSSSGSYFPEQPVLGKDSLPIAFANAENFEQESLESIKIGIRKAKAEEKARKKAEEEARLAAEQSAALAKADEVAVEAYSELQNQFQNPFHNQFQK
jgi:hypothetical protein